MPGYARGLAAQASGRVNAYVAALKSTGSADRTTCQAPVLRRSRAFRANRVGRPPPPALVVVGSRADRVADRMRQHSALLLSQTAGRRREMAIRLSLGGTRLQILRQLLVESLVLGAIGGMGGVGVAAAAISMLSSLSLPGQPLLELVHLDYRLLAYGLALAIFSSLTFGLAPALQLLRDSQSTAMARGAKGASRMSLSPPKCAPRWYCSSRRAAATQLMDHREHSSGL